MFDRSREVLDYATPCVRDVARLPRIYLRLKSNYWLALTSALPQ